jgi:hypothetical protein
MSFVFIKDAVPILLKMATQSDSRHAPVPPDGAVPAGTGNKDAEIGKALKALTTIDPLTAISVIKEFPSAYRALTRIDYHAANIQYDRFLENLRREGLKGTDSKAEHLRDIRPGN